MLSGSAASSSRIRSAVRPIMRLGWRIEDSGLRRTLFLHDEAVTVIDYSAMPRWSGTVVLDNLRYRYRLTIQNAPEGS